MTSFSLSFQDAPIRRVDDLPTNNDVQPQAQAAMMPAALKSFTNRRQRVRL
jgi:hypothetical protein